MLFLAYATNAPADSQLLLPDHLEYPLSFNHQPDIQVEIQDLKDVYDKVQIKKVPTSEQRIAQGKVNGVAWTTGQIKNITVFVQRTPEAAEKANDTIGWYCRFFS